MPKIAFKEMKIRLPDDVVNTISPKEIVILLTDKFLSKAEYYRSKGREMEHKYQTNFLSFKNRVEQAQEEKFSEWDDVILWEGYELAYQEWHRKFEELKLCII